MLELLSGGITGIIGGIASSVLSYVNNRQNNKHELDVLNAKADIEVKKQEAATKAIIAEAQANVKISENQAFSEIATEELAALKATFKDQSSTSFEESYMGFLMKSKYTAWIGGIISFLFGLSDFSKETARVFITYYLLGLMTWITYLSFSILQAKLDGGLSAETASQLFNSSIETARYMLISSISWWFVDRQASKTLKYKNKKG